MARKITSKPLMNLGSLEVLYVGGVKFVRQDIKIDEQTKSQLFDLAGDQQEENLIGLVIDLLQDKEDQFDSGKFHICVMCEGCRYWKQYTDQTKTNLGECKRFSVESYSDFGCVCGVPNATN